MKNRKDIIDLIRNTDEETMEKLVKDYPQSDKKKADKLFRRIERRVEGTDAAGRDELIEVSGVERYRPQKFRRVVSAAACIALVGAGIGTAYAVKANAPSGKSPASEVTEEVPSDMAAAASRSVPENIDKDYIIELCSNARSNYSALSISYTNTNSNDHPSDHIYTGTMQIDNTADTFWAQEDVDILWKGSSTKKYSGFFFACGNNKVFRIAEDEEKYRVDNNNPGPDSMFYRPEKWVSDWLSPVENWDIGDKLTYIGRDCISIHGNRRIDNYDISFTAFIDTETGIPLHFKQKGQYQNVFDVNSITYNDNTGFMTKDGFREFLKDYEPAEEDYDLSFLDEEPGTNSSEELPTKDELYQLVVSSNAHYDKVLACYETRGLNSDDTGEIIFYDKKAGTVYTNIQYTDSKTGSFLRKQLDFRRGNRIVHYFPEDNDISVGEFENADAKEPEFTLPDKGNFAQLLKEQDEWEIIGKKNFCGRDCAVVSLRTDISSITMYIDLETGLFLYYDQKDENGKSTCFYQITSLHFNEDAEGSDCPTAEEFKELVKDCPYAKNADLSFLDGTAVKTTTEPPTEGTTEKPAQQSDVFAVLDALDYHAISCDGLPTHKLTAPDGTVYLLHLDENSSYQYVWRRPSLIADADNEAPLTDEALALLRANWNSLDITEADHSF